ncbi:MAG: glycerophosphodiester phosphodiesterase, partial [Acidimicrobiales bacterium]
MPGPVRNAPVGHNDAVPDSPVMAIAHRGDPVGHRENTLPALAAAVAKGADMVELDLRRTRDGAVVLLHDPTLGRLWGVDGDVDAMDLSELRVLGSGDVRIPTLADALDEVGLALMVDFTGPEVVPGAVEAVRGAQSMERALFVTHDIDALRLVRTLAPEARIGLSWLEPDLPSPALVEELGAEFWNPWFGLATPAAVASVHDLGLRVSCWTVDEPRHMARLVAAGVDAVGSNH